MMSGVSDVDVLRHIEQGANVFEETFVRAQSFLLAAPWLVERRRFELNDLRPTELRGKNLVDPLKQWRRKNAHHSKRAIDRGDVCELKRLCGASDFVAEPGDLINVPLVRNAPEKPRNAEMLYDRILLGELLEILLWERLRAALIDR